MAFDLSLLQPAKAQRKPPRVVIHGPPGVGKTIFAACAPRPIFLPTEDGLESLNQLPFDVPAFPLAKTWDDVMGALEALATRRTTSSGRWPSTASTGSNRLCGPRRAGATIGRTLRRPATARAIRRRWTCGASSSTGWNICATRGMAYILIAHSIIKRFDAPDAEPYDRYMLKLQQKAGDLLTENVDAVLFANFKTYTTETDVGFKKKVRRGIGTGERAMFTEERPAFIAKNRYGLPAELPLDYEHLAKVIFNPARAEPAPAETEEGETTNG
jgi:hypothetical protein